MVGAKNNENDPKKGEIALLGMVITKAIKGFRRTKTHKDGMIDVWMQQKKKLEQESASKSSLEKALQHPANERKQQIRAFRESIRDQ